MENRKQLQNRINDLLSIPQRKINQLLNMPLYLIGCFGILPRYGFELNEISWLMFVQTISNKLSIDDIEYEFSKEEMDNLLALKDLPAFKK